MATERVAAVTVIRGEGGCEAYMNGVVNAELQRLQQRMNEENERRHAAMRAELERIKLDSELQRKRCGALLGERMAERRRLYDKKDSIPERVWVTVYAAVYGFMHALVVKETDPDVPREGAIPERGKRSKGMRQSDRK